MSDKRVDEPQDDEADQGTLDHPGPQAGAELGLTDGEPNSFEPEEADPAVSTEADDTGLDDTVPENAQD